MYTELKHETNPFVTGHEGSPGMAHITFVTSQGMSRGDTSVDPNTIAALQQAQLFALQSQALTSGYVKIAISGIL